MNVEEELARFTPPGPVVLTIGVFDGVHLGHQHLLRLLCEEAHKRRCQSAVVTFTNHPVTVLNDNVAVEHLSSLEERVRLLKFHGVDHVVAIPFTHELSLCTPQRFVTLLCEVLHMQGMVVGPDFALGHRRQGTTTMLRELGGVMHFFVDEASLLTYEGRVVSSTAIRNSLRHGDLAEVNRSLGRPFRLMGTVERGAGRGHSLGFPTANIGIPAEHAIPADGVYATWARVDNKWHPSATSIGVQPTFGECPRKVEAFIVDFQDDLYDHQVTLDFVVRLRDELKFSSKEALAEQMNLDTEDARCVLEKVTPEQD